MQHSGHHNQGHEHGHSQGHDHQHAIADDADKRYLLLALLLLLAFMAVEIVVGLLSSSLALLSDAGHMLSDAGAIGLALLAMHWASRPAQGQFTFGYKRAEIFSAMINGLTLLLLAIWFVIEALLRFIEPANVHGVAVLVTALAGIVVNFGAIWLMSRANRENLNVEGSFQHILTDLYAFIATAIAGALIWITGWNRLDAVATLIVAALMLKSGYFLVRKASLIFFEAAPSHLNPQRIRQAIAQFNGVTGIQDLHVWEVTSGFPALAAHVFVPVSLDCHDKRRELETMLKADFGIEHTTLQMDHALAGDILPGCSAQHSD